MKINKIIFALRRTNKKSPLARGKEVFLASQKRIVFYEFLSKLESASYTL